MKKPRALGATFVAPLDVLADRGREALRQRRFKEAVEVFKQLARQDPRPEWAHRLADAYVGRAHALADKGMFKEAAMVLENTMSPDGTIREPVLYLTWLVRQGQHQKAAQAALRLVKRPAGGRRRPGDRTGSSPGAHCAAADRDARQRSWERPEPRGSSGTRGLAPGEAGR